MGVKRNTVSTNFSAGELDPRLVMRSDVQAWQQGAKRIENMRPLLHGGLRTRPGTDYCASLGAEAALVPFEFSETQGYVLCFKGSTIDIYFDDGTFATTVGSAPWTLAQAKELRLAQSGDTMILCNKNVQTRKLTRTGSSSFALSTFAFDTSSTVANKKLCPFYRYAASSITMTPSATTGAITLTSSAAFFTSAYATDNIHLRIAGKQVRVTGFTSNTVANATVVETLAGTSATTDWDEEAFSSVRGWPQAVCFHNERLVLGGGLSRPSGVWASQVGRFFNFDPDNAADDKAIWSGVSADKVVEVLHLASFKHLSMFTDQVELYQPEDETRPWAPDTTAYRQQTGFGCISSIRPQRFDEAVIFVQKFGKQVREFLYNSTAQTYSSDALSVMNPSRIVSPVSMAAVTASRDVEEQYAYIVMAAGGMAVLHSLRAQRITAWSWWETQGLFRSVCAVNGRVFLLVERTVGGSPVYYLEKLSYDHALDCAKTVAVSIGGTTATGLSHLEGIEARAVNNGYAYNPDTIASGTYQLVEEEWGATSAVIGLAFTPRLETLPPEIQVEQGSSRGKPVRIARVGVQVHESLRLVVEQEGASISNIDDDYSVPPDPETGMHIFGLRGVGRDRTVTVICDVPLPLTILGLAMEVVG